MAKKPKQEPKEEPESPNQGMMQLQIAEQGLQNILLQKQVFQFELIETNNALEEVKKAQDGDVFKVVGSVMFKTKKQDLEKELEKKKNILNLRLKAIEKQEEDLKSSLIKSRDKVLKDLKQGS